MPIDDFEESGYCVLDLPDPRPVHSVREKLLQEARAFLKAPQLTLEASHEVLGTAPEPHLSFQVHMTEFLRRNAFHLEVLRANKELLYRFWGQDIDAEAAPYLRIVRPGIPGDNIGLHRDTVYGGSPFELSVFIPFVDLDEKTGFHVEPGSHLKGLHEIPFIRMEASDSGVVKGSPKHKLGYPYAPQVLDKAYPVKTVPVAVGINQVLVFMQSILHGSVENRSSRTRWSCDTRIVNPYTPIKRVRTETFSSLSRSPVSKAAERYLKASETPPSS